MSTSPPSLTLPRDTLSDLLAPYGVVLSPQDWDSLNVASGRSFADAAGNIDVLRLLGWVATTRRRSSVPSAAADLYTAHKERARSRQAAISLSGRDIGPLPAVANAKRKAACKTDFRLFCESYFPQTFRLTWSGDHLKVIRKIEIVVMEGGQLGMAMPRGSGKTSLCEIACIWASCYGHRQFVVLIGPDESQAQTMNESIQTELMVNEALAEDFPEVCFPIQALQGINQRASGQLCMNKPTRIVLTKDETCLPTIEGSEASGAIIRVAGITGRIRGMKHKRWDGATVRPDLVLIDDPQTDESAKSPSQSAFREAIVSGAVLGLAGPAQKIAALMTLTVIRRDDMADRVLSRDRHPEWQGERTKMVYAFPENEGLWSKYAELRSDGLKNERGLRDATEFYRANQAAMDLGSVVAWPARFNPDEISAIQHAMNLRFRDEPAFFAEYQNEPVDEAANADVITTEQVLGRLHGLERGVVPLNASHLTVFIDVQDKALFWLVAAWGQDFTGHVIDYGTEPDQNVAYFTLRDIRRTIRAAAPKAGREAAIYSALERLADRLLSKDWRREDGSLIRIERCLVDANWGESTDTVYQFCRQTKHAAVVMPAHGRYVGAASTPFADYARRPGDRIGLNWRVPVNAGKRAVRHVLFDTNFWKSFVQARFSVLVGDPGALSLFGSAPTAHLLIADHLTAETKVRTEGRGRSVDEWRLKSPGLDNHWLDCLVGASVGASMQGVALYGVGAGLNGSRSRARVKLSDLQRKRGG